MPTTIFWPADVKHSGFCYGWTKPVLCVAGVLEANTQQDVELALRNLGDLPQWKFLSDLCGNDPILLGRCVSGQRDGVWFPTLELIPPIDYNVIHYYRHASNTLRFYSLDVLRLDATERLDTSKLSVYWNVSRHDFTRPRKSTESSGIDNTVINQFNAAKTLDDILARRTKWNILSSTSPIIDILGLYISKFLILLSLCLASVCNVPLPLSPALLFKDITATVQQMDVRSEQADFFVNGVDALRRRSSTPMPLYSARYTNFFNTIWLILNDITIGFAFGAFLCENHIALSQFVNHAIEIYLIDWIQWALGWLDAWPAGLKLNTELSRFYSHTFIHLVAMWGNVLQMGTPYSSSVIYILGAISCGGVTLAISLLMDMLALSTAHIYICYFITTTVYQKMLRTAGSLWNLFRGKRYNVLRNRTDSWEYDIDQLLFGTILFTLLAFLFPTVLAYYSLFALMRLATLLLQAGMDTLLAFMNHFPLFALLLRAKDPWRLPGGIYFCIEHSKPSRHPLLTVKNQPVPFSSIFFQYIRLWSRLAAHYNPLRLLYCVISGEYLAAIPRYSIRYNKIPSDHLPPSQKL